MWIAIIIFLVFMLLGYMAYIQYTYKHQVDAHVSMKNGGTDEAYANWNAGEPNNAGTGEEAVQTYGNGLWNDLPAEYADANNGFWALGMKLPYTYPFYGKPELVLSDIAHKPFTARAEFEADLAKKGAIFWRPVNAEQTAEMVALIKDASCWINPGLGVKNIWAK